MRNKILKNPIIIAYRCTVYFSTTSILVPDGCFSTRIAPFSKLRFLSSLLHFFRMSGGELIRLIKKRHIDIFWIDERLVGWNPPSLDMNRDCWSIEKVRKNKLFFWSFFLDDYVRIPSYFSYELLFSKNIPLLDVSRCLKYE